MSENTRSEAPNVAEADPGAAQLAAMLAEFEQLKAAHETDIPQLSGINWGVTMLNIRAVVMANLLFGPEGGLERTVYELAVQRNIAAVVAGAKVAHAKAAERQKTLDARAALLDGVPGVPVDRLKAGA